MDMIDMFYDMLIDANGNIDTVQEMVDNAFGSAVDKYDIRYQKPKDAECIVHDINCFIDDYYDNIKHISVDTFVDWVEVGCPVETSRLVNRDPRVVEFLKALDDKADFTLGDDMSWCNWGE